MHNLITFSDIRFCYAQVCALGEVNFSIQEKTLTALVGPNGGGKSTLLKLLTGLLHPESGHIHCERTIAYVPQTPSFETAFPLTVWEAVLMGTLGVKIAPLAHYTVDQKQKAFDAIEKVNLSGLEKRGIGQLSGGQLRRVIIARALAADADIIALDEPDANLDIDATHELYTVLNRLKSEKTIIMASHHINEMLDIADRALYVRGTVTEYLKPQDLKEQLKDGLIR
ncbi:MAG: ATP-binding cassette domain-containing protein [Eubacteriales bacterium]|nr:ATP-binding cassette domain-containing protein [Eubacteriales bacterium]